MDITGASERLQPVDADATPAWRDEVELHAWDPGSDVVVVARLAVHPNRPAATADVIIRRAGDTTYEHRHTTDDVPLADWDDLAIGAARLQELEPLRSWELNLDDDENGLSLRFDGRSPALPTGHRRYEQTGIVVGRVVVGGDEVAIDGIGHREHAWGGPEHHHTATFRAVGFVGRRTFTVTVHDDGRPPAGFVHEDGADHAVTAAELDEPTGTTPTLRVTTDDGRTATLRLTPAAQEPVITPDARWQPAHVRTDDGLEGRCLVGTPLGSLA